MRRFSNRFRRSGVVASLAAALCAGALFPASAAPSAANVRFAVDGVGGGTFTEARLAANPGAPEETPAPLCLTLAGGSPDNPEGLIEWMKSTDAGGALASRQDATLTVRDDQKGLKKGVYRLSDVSVRQFRLQANRDMTKPRLEGVEINCDGVEDALNPNPSG